jgi:predicted GIY-YIG superfamily endonuclease
MAVKKYFQKKGTFWVYILECRDGSYYTGYTNNLEKRVELHNTGKGAKYTASHRPVKLIWSKQYKYYRHAIQEEARIKTLRRTQKEKLINNF